MFASMRKFEMRCPAYPIDDIESLLYLICFCYDEFYLPWLQDYMSQQNMQHFIQLRLKNAERHMHYINSHMPLQITKALKYISHLND
jgi:hypothetical protein